MYAYLESNKKTIKGFPSSSAADSLLQKTRVQSLGWEDPLEEGNPLQYSCLENSLGQRGPDHYSPRVTKSQTRLKQPSTPARERQLQWF